MPAHATTYMNSAPEDQGIHGTVHRQATAEEYMYKPCDPLSDSLYSLRVISSSFILGASSIQALTTPTTIRHTGPG